MESAQAGDLVTPVVQYVLDSSAILCFLRDEAGADVIEPLLMDADAHHFLHAINWVEIRYLEQRGQLPEDNPFRQFIETVGVEISTEISPTYLERVAFLKAHNPPIALGDCFAAALAQTLGAMLITTDRGELQKIADKKECAILFLR